MTTEEYFGESKQLLSAPVFPGWATREEYLLYNGAWQRVVFTAGHYDRAIDTAAYWLKVGCYRVEILKTIDNDFCVLGWEHLPKEDN